MSDHKQPPQAFARKYDALADAISHGRYVYAFEDIYFASASTEVQARQVICRLAFPALDKMSKAEMQNEINAAFAALHESQSDE